MTKRYTLLVPQAIHRAVVAQATSELPNECCGLLGGVLSGDSVRVVRRYPLVNAANQPQIEYLSESRSLLAAHKAMRADGLDLVAVYHSHPASAAIPSRTDCERSYAGETFINLIISLAGGQPILRAWWITQQGYTEAKWEFAGDDGVVADG